MQTDPRIDAYIAQAAPFAQPILAYLRELVHRALPQGAEGIKWGMPHFLLGGKNIAGMSAHKAHCAFIVHGAGRLGPDEGMGPCGRITSLSDLPPDTELEGAIRSAAERVLLQGSATKGMPKRAKLELPVPDDLQAALAKNHAAQSTFAGFSPSHRREYLEWIGDAKRPETRERRIAQTIEWCASGRKRNWKYESR